MDDTSISDAHTRFYYSPLFRLKEACYNREEMRDEEAIWLSIRMRASHGGEHLSGAERLVPHDYAPMVIRSLLSRAEEHTQGRATEIAFRVDMVSASRIRRVPVLPVKTVVLEDVSESWSLADHLLREWGVAEKAVVRAMDALSRGASPDGTNMRGAMLMDAATGERLESDSYRGVRVSFVDMTPQAQAIFETRFRDRFPASRLRDALILASKVMSLEGVVAELCWSDDPNYTTGYVASRPGGYVRVSPMKLSGVPLGGRVFFVDVSRFDPERDVAYLESQPVLVTIPDESVFKEA